MVLFGDWVQENLYYKGHDAELERYKVLLRTWGKKTQKLNE